MKISELKVGQGKVDIEFSIKSKSETRTFQKFGNEMKVANAVAKDDSGEITLSLWNEDTDKVNVGDKVKITNGYVSEFNGTKQLSSGRYGKLEVLGKEPQEESSKSNAESSPAKSEEQAKPEKFSNSKPAKSKKSFDEEVAF